MPRTSRPSSKTTATAGRFDPRFRNGVWIAFDTIGYRPLKVYDLRKDAVAACKKMNAKAVAQ